jgi:hypothetical protein
MPDVRLIKNALSLSTKSVGLAPAEIKHQAKTTSKNGEKGTGSHAVALRGGEAGLTAFLHGSSSTWQKARDMVMPSTPPIVVPKFINNSKGKGQSQTYGQMIIGDIKAAWTRTLSTYSHADFIHYIRNQIMATIQLEIQQAILLAKYLVEVSKNVSEATRPFLQQGANQVLKTYHDVRSYTTSINITASADIATSRAKSGYENVTSKAAMTSQKGREAIQQARAGLEYLVSEARRKAGILPDSSTEPLPIEKGRFRTLKEKIKTHRGKFVPGLNRGKTQIPPRAPRETGMSMKQKFMQALHYVSSFATRQGRRRSTIGRYAFGCMNDNCMSNYGPVPVWMMDSVVDIVQYVFLTLIRGC